MEQTQIQSTCTFPNEENKEIFDLLKEKYKVNKLALLNNVKISYKNIKAITNHHVNTYTDFGTPMQKIIGYTILLILDQCGITDNKRILMGLMLDASSIKEIKNIDKPEALQSLFKKTTVLGNFFEKKKIVDFLDGSNNTLTLNNKELQELTTVTGLNKSSNDTQTAGNKKTKKRTKKKKKSKSKKAKKSKSKSKRKKTKSKTKKRRHRRR